MPTPNLGLVQLVSAQAQPEVTINTNLDTLDAVVLKKTGDTMSGGLKIQRTAATSGTPLADLWVQTPADTGLASAESLSVLIDGSAATRTFGSGGGTISQQRLVAINGPTYAAASALTISAAATLHIFGAPTAGTNVTITNNAALWVQGAIVFGNNVVGTSKAGFTFVQGQNSAQPTAMFIQPVRSGTFAAATESPMVIFDSSATYTFGTGALTTQRDVVFKAPTIAFSGASTLTNAATVAIEGAPAAGTNATITNSYALWVQAGGARIQGHLNMAGGTAPTAAAGSNAGTSPPAPVVVAGAADTRGTITFGTGTSPAAGNMVVVTFGTAFGSAPIVLVSSNNALTEALGPYATSVSTTQFTLGAQTAPAASQGNGTYSFNWWAVQ